MEIKITDLVKAGKEVSFVFYSAGNLWYDAWADLATGPRLFRFPVPLTDVGTATFNAKDKAMLFMRWMRQYLANPDSLKIVGFVGTCPGDCVTFKYFREGNLYYETAEGFKFPVPVSEIKDAFHEGTVYVRDNASKYQPWIDKLKEVIEKG